jgi:hypothetical protein
MAAVTARLSQFAAEVGCQVGLVHHLNKDFANGRIFNRLRGAGALHGWMEWGAAITVVNPEDERDDWIRRIEFESKEVATDPIYYRIVDGDEGATSLVKADSPARSTVQKPTPITQKTRATEGSRS